MDKKQEKRGDTGRQDQQKPRQPQQPQQQKQPQNQEKDRNEKAKQAPGFEEKRNRQEGRHGGEMHAGL